MKDYQERKCRNCGGGKFTEMVWGLECWYCGSEYEHKKTPLGEPVGCIYELNPYATHLPYNHTTTYFAPTSPRKFWGENW